MVEHALANSESVLARAQKASPVRFGPWRVRLGPKFEGININQLVELIETPSNYAASSLGGRSLVTVGDLTGVGPVVVKRYTRGGVFRNLVKHRYLRWGRMRADLEFDLLDHARSVGINAPEPVAAVSRGSMLYRAWLVTRQIPGNRNLVDVDLVNDPQASIIMEELGKQVSMLISNNIFHVDLHPGNVVLDNEQKLFILDFDKACIFKGSRIELRDRYLHRWRRAVIKHQLPQVFSELMCVQLRKNHET